MPSVPSVGFNYYNSPTGYDPFFSALYWGNDREGTEGGPKGDRRSQCFFLSVFFLPPIPRPLSKRLSRASNRDRRRTEGGPKAGPKACILLVSGTSGGHVLFHDVCQSEELSPERLSGTAVSRIHDDARPPCSVV